MKLLTPFGENIDKDLPLNDYPRPQLVRDNWQNLNGKWQCGFGKDGVFGGYDREIIVPFSPESVLSGVEKILSPQETLYYFRTFEFKKINERTLLHFGAVDYFCSVYINDIFVGAHRGGYLPFTFDISDKVKEGRNSIRVVVTDPTDTGVQARGKQSSKRGGIWYTPQSGIWQTVWLEQVSNNYIKSLRITPDIDMGQVTVTLNFSEVTDNARIFVYDGEQEVVSVNVLAGTAIIPMHGAKLWTPENPFLYDMVVQTSSEEVYSYFGMRKFSVGKDEKGVTRMTLNNEPYFQNGLLDQGYWSDGLYTAPSDEALIYDIETMKKMGFNMLRKHIKIEPLRWYYHCDRLGMIVWQDAVSGGGIYKQSAIMTVPAIDLGLCAKITRKSDGQKNYAFFSRENEDGRKEYYEDSERMIDLLYNTVSLAVWVPFNEGWGQFDALKAVSFYKAKDRTRIVDHASGFHDQGGGDLNSFHIYFTSFRFPKWDEKDDRAIVLSEFGGYSIREKGHMYNEKKFFGYRKYRSQNAYIKALEQLYLKKIVPAIERGLSAAVYTEVSDVEDECNGLLTFDRKIVKIPIEKMKEINSKVKL